MSSKTGPPKYRRFTFTTKAMLLALAFVGAVTVAGKHLVTPYFVEPIRYTDDAELPHIRRHENVLILVYGRAGGLAQYVRIHGLVSDWSLKRRLYATNTVFMVADRNYFEGNDLIEAHGITSSDIPAALFFHSSAGPTIVENVGSVDDLIQVMEQE